MLGRCQPDSLRLLLTSPLELAQTRAEGEEAVRPHLATSFQPLDYRGTMLLVADPHAKSTVVTMPSLTKAEPR